MRILFPDLSRLVAVDSDRPASLPLVREATVDGLREFGHEAVLALSLDGPPADLALVDAVDAPSADALGALLELRERKVPIVLRLHGAWTVLDGDTACEDVDPGEAPVPLKRVLELADRVIVSTRSHLVRLASAHAIDSQRVKLLAPPQPQFESVAALERSCDRRSALLIGEQDSLAFEAAREALAASGLDVTVFQPRPSDAATIGYFRSAVEAADTVAVAAAVPWSDRVLVDACVALGRPVVAACGPVLDEPARPLPVVRLPLDATEDEWGDGIARCRAFSASELCPAEVGLEGPGEALRRLTAILFEAAASGGDCSEHQAA